MTSIHKVIDAMMNIISLIPQQWNNFSVTPEFMIAEGDKVFAKCKATADGMETIFGHYFEIKDGKMSMFMAFDDTLSMYNAMKK